MANELFHGSQLKIKRANEHIMDLEQRLRVFAAGDAYSLRLDPYPEDPHYLLEVYVAEAVDPAFALVVGDALHNLRAALDFAVSDIEFAYTGARGENISFPARRSRKEFETAVKNRLEHKVPPEITALLIDTIQAYQGGDGESLWFLHKLEIQDKHRLLLPHMQMNGVFKVRLEDGTGKEISLGVLVVSPSRYTSRVLMGNNLKIADKGHLGMAIFFEQGLPMGGESILPTLRQLSELVRGTVNLLRREFLMLRIS